MWKKRMSRSRVEKRLQVRRRATSETSRMEKGIQSEVEEWRIRKSRIARKVENWVMSRVEEDEVEEK